jgi:hypothetical protein
MSPDGGVLNKLKLNLNYTTIKHESAHIKKFTMRAGLTRLSAPPKTNDINFGAT